MKTLFGFVALVVLILGGLKTHQTVSAGRTNLEARCAALQEEVNDLTGRYQGYWPRFERMEAALMTASNTISDVSEKLRLERASVDPLRQQVATLSAERIKQSATEARLRKELAGERSKAEQLKGNVDDVRARQNEIEIERKQLEERVLSL